MTNTTTAAQRHNARQDKIWETALKLKAERDAADAARAATNICEHCGRDFGEEAPLNCYVVDDCPSYFEAVGIIHPDHKEEPTP